jgi:predicted O-methyltransferase YrrM
MKNHHRSLIGLLRDNLICSPKRGAEIGVFRGETSLHLARAFPNCELICVDVWEPESIIDTTMGKQAQTKHRLPSFSMEEVRRCAGANLLQIPNCTIMKMESFAASKRIGNNELDFVFIDADHTYEKVREDIRAWWPTVKKNGILCGHDYGSPNKKWGVKKAVDEIFGSLVKTLPGRIWFVNV